MDHADTPERQDPPTARTRSPLMLLQLLTITMALAPVVVAAISAVVSYRATIGRERLIAIDSIYDEFSSWNLAIIDSRALSHLIGSPNEYGELSRLVELSLADATDQRLYELLLGERTVAIGAFNVYERAVVDLAEARRLGDNFRPERLESLVRLHEQELLLNPRLRSLLDEPNENVARIVRERYAKHVIESAPTAPEPDDVGPIGRELERRGLAH